MSLRAEQDLIRRDAELPGLAKLLDAAAFRDALQAAADVSIQSARLRYLRYKPGQNCLAAYTLNVAGTEVECHAKAYRHCDITKLEKAEARPANAGPLGGGRFIWPRLGIEVCVFPNDNKLASLTVLTDGLRREDFLRRHLPDNAELWASNIRTLAYKPERRWVGALEVNGVPRAVCKLYGDTAFEEVRSKSKHFGPGEVLRLAPLIGRSKGRSALFFGWERGQLLSRAMLESSFDPAILFRVGVALAELQRQSVAKLPVRANDTEASALIKLGDFLEFLLPAESERIRALATRLASAIRSLPQGDSVVHGDFYAKQILFAGDEITVLDLDEAARGDASDDLGTFLAHLEREVAVGRMSAAQLAAYRAQFLEGYRSAVGTVDSGRIQLRTAARLFGRLPHFFRNHDAEWPQRTVESLARVEALLGQTDAAAPIRVAFDAKLPALERALQRTTAEPLIAAALRERHPEITEVKLQQIELRRHKAGRRALIEYELESQRAGRMESLVVLGKLQRRGINTENLAAIRELRETSFSADSSDGIAIPEVVGVIPDLGMTLHRRVAGKQLAKRLTGFGGITASRRAAEAISKLHHSGMLLGNTHTIADELNILEARLTALAVKRPDWELRLTSLLQACHQLAGRLRIVSPRPIHRDFYHDQLLLDGDRVWLLDLDLLCAGDPALDGGNFVGHLIEWGIRSPSEQPALAAAAAAFTDRFLELGGEDQREAVEIYTTLTLVRHISLSTQFPERAPFTPQILELCEERCGLEFQTFAAIELVPTTP
jgi:tRNA A-37 threonylcarbamoyl transferase component Bud32